MEKRDSFDVIVAGAGPAGSTTALFLARGGLKVLLLDKAHFPRDKTCADNKTWLCTSIVKELGLWNSFKRLPKQEIDSLLFSSPGGNVITVELEKEKIARDGPHYNVRRKVFDNFLFQSAKKHSRVTSLEGFTVVSALFSGSRVIGVRGRDSRGRVHSFFAPVVVGADGSTSAFARSVGVNPVLPSRHASSARAYFRGVIHSPRTVELHYLKGVCPGYFWIFPVDNGLCNVGVGIPTEQVRHKKLVLRKMLSEIIRSPKFAKRFSRAKRVSPVGEWGITIGGPRRKICGDGFVLVGDAGNTSVTFGGEGVGPGMRSGKIAAHAILLAFKKRDFSHATLRAYEDDLWKIRGPENQSVGLLEFLAKRPQLFDWVVSRANRNHRLKKLASAIATDYSNARHILHPSTLLALLR